MRTFIFIVTFFVATPAFGNCLDTLLDYRKGLQKALEKSVREIKGELDYLRSLEENLPSCFKGGIGGKLQRQRMTLQRNHQKALVTPPNVNDMARRDRERRKRRAQQHYRTRDNVGSREPVVSGLNLRAEDAYELLKKNFSTGFTLNFFMPIGLGSWIVGDVAGGGIGLGVQGAGYFFISLGASLLVEALIYVGVVLGIVGWVLPLITVSIFIPRFNRNLKKKLGLNRYNSMLPSSGTPRYYAVQIPL